MFQNGCWTTSSTGLIGFTIECRWAGDKMGCDGIRGLGEVAGDG